MAGIEGYLALGGALVAVALILWAAAYAQGRNRERARQAEASEKLNEEVQDVVDRGRDAPVVVDDDFLHHPSPGSSPGGDVPPTARPS